ncbi:MAG: TIGR01777 family oxidoreductase [Planctomycetota bacterium]|nr:TIGR01777 family oxidoreductase [Planctomycetota bacterium]
MRVAVTGATGFVGRHLCPALREAGHEVVALVRPKPGRDLAEVGARLGGVEARAYDGFDAGSTQEALAGCEAVINLAGENILGQRWSEAFLAHCRASRVDTTRALVEALGAMDQPPRILLGASAIGWYGTHAPEVEITEASSQGTDTLARLCIDWEQATRGAEALGTRVVLLRIGIVLGPGGGALAKMERPFRLGLGGRLASGRQIMSWVHLDDTVGLIRFALETEAVTGPLNVTAPEPASNADLTRALAAQLGRPAFLPVPAFALKLLFGEGAHVLLTGARVLPAVAAQAGYSFAHPTLGAALENLYPR